MGEAINKEQEAKITFLHAELSDHSYNQYKLEAYASLPSTMDKEEVLLNYFIGKDVLTIHCSKEAVIENNDVVKFVAFLEKNSGLASDGFSFRLSISCCYVTDEYYIGGRHGYIILDNTKIKHHQLYLLHANLTGTIILKPFSNKKKVRFVCFNDNQSITTEAKFRECIPYSVNEIWEYSFILNENSLRQDCSFYVELTESNATYKDDNFVRYYKLWEQVARPV